MNNSIKEPILAILISLIASASSLRAEMRIWTDKKGNSVEAELVKAFSDKVVLRTPRGKQLQVPASGLCDEDQEYLKAAVPPEIKMEVSIVRDTSTLESDSDYVNKLEKIGGNVTLTKLNSDPSNRKFTAILYIFAREIKGKGKGKILLVLDKAGHEFSFEKQNKIEFSVSQSTTEYTRYSSSSRDKGQIYAGYLLCVEDVTGTLLFTKASDSVYVNMASQIRKADINSHLDSQFNVREKYD